MLGDDSYERLARGERTEEHYLGDQLLAPDFTLRDRNGKPWRLRDHRGKVVVMNFWTMTCQPCVEELPSFIDAGRDRAQAPGRWRWWPSRTDKNWQEVAGLFPPKFRLKVLFDPERKVVRDKYGTQPLPRDLDHRRRGVVRHARGRQAKLVGRADAGRRAQL